MKLFVISILVCVTCVITSPAWCFPKNSLDQRCSLLLKSALQGEGTDDSGSEALNSWIELGCNRRDLIPASELSMLAPLTLAATSEPHVQDEVLQKLYDRVGIDVSGPGYAYLHDRIRLDRGEVQAFGAVPEIADMRARYPHTQSSVNVMRDRLGLVPLSVFYARINEGLERRNGLADLLRPDLALRQPVLPTKPELRARLMELLRKDRASQVAGVSSETRRQVQVAGASQIVAIIRKHGFPDAREVGRSGVHAVFFLVQHAAQRPSFMKEALELVEPLVASGDMPRVYFALLTDRVRVLHHEMQLYGTQAGRDRHGSFVYPIEDIGRVNRRRAEMWLSPLPPASS